MTENELWLLSFYRTSEIGGALFFGQLAKSMRPGPVQRDMSKHFADEAQHAWYWTSCIETLGGKPLRLSETYQDQYFTAAGIPANLMEVLALTQIFERRVAGVYARHVRAPGLHETVRTTLKTILEDERWHISWVGEALRGMEGEYGKETIEKTLRRYYDADQAIYRSVVSEHAERVQGLFSARGAHPWLPRAVCGPGQAPPGAAA